MSEDIGSLAVSIGLDSSGFQNGVSNINRSLRVLDSDFRANTAALGANGTELDRLRLRSTNLTNSMGLQQQKVDALEAAYNRSVAATGSNSRATQELEIRLNQARTGLANMGNQLVAVDRQIATQSSNWTRLGTTLNSVGTRMKAVGDSMVKVGKDLSTKVTAPILGIGVAISKMSMDFEGSMAKVSTISDDAEVPIDDLRKSILKLSGDTGIASGEIADNVYDAISAGQSTGDAVNFVTNSTKLAKSGFAEAGQSLDLLTTILNSYGLKSSEVNRVSDVLIQTQNKGKVTVGELSESMGKVIPTANQYGVNLEQVATGYAIMTSKGIKAAETTTYMNSMLNEMGKSGTVANKAIEEATGKTFPELIKSGKSVGDILSIMNDYAKKNGKSLTDMFGSAEAGKAALVLSGGAGKEFNEMLKAMGLSAGETDKAFDKVNNTTGSRLTKSLNSLKNAGIQLGDSLAPIIEKISSGIKSLTDKFNTLTPAQQENIVKFGLIAAAIGPVVLVVGKLVTIGGALVTGLGTISTAMGAASVATTGIGVAGVAGASGLAGVGAALGSAVVAAAPFLLAGAAVAGVGLLVYKGMTEEAVPAVDLFANKVEHTTQTVKDANGNLITNYDATVIKISDATEKAVGAYIKLDDGATKAITNLYVNSTVITAKISTELTTKFNEMGTQIKTGIDKHFAESYGTIDNFFKDSGALTTAEEIKILADMKIKNEEKKKETDTYTKQIQDILKKASDEKRALTLDEQVKINEIQNKMKIGAVKALSAGEVESKVILERLKAYSTRITAEQASEEIKNANKARDGSITAANEKYTNSVAEIIKMRDESKTITADQADKLIAEAKRQNEESVKHAEEMRVNVVSKITAMNDDTAKNVDLNTGKILNAWDKLKNWWDSWWPEPKNVSVTQTTTYEENEARGSIPMNATGNRNFSGGLTTLHEKGYEVYNLPGGSRIYNHQASEDLVLKTAQEVAKGVVGSNKGITQNLNIYSPNPLSPSETARQNRRALQELALNF